MCSYGPVVGKRIPTFPIFRNTRVSDSCPLGGGGGGGMTPWCVVCVGGGVLHSYSKAGRLGAGIMAQGVPVHQPRALVSLEAVGLFAEAAVPVKKPSKPRLPALDSIRFFLIRSSAALLCAWGEHSGQSPLPKSTKTVRCPNSAQETYFSRHTPGPFGPQPQG